MIILSMSEAELDAHWDRIEEKHPWGPMQLGYREPSKYLLRAYEAGLVTWDVAVELCMAAMRVGCTDP